MVGEIREWIYMSFDKELESPFLVVEELPDGSFETVDSSGMKSVFWGDFISSLSKRVCDDKD